MEDEGELWPNTKIAETMVSLWAVSGNCVDWTGWMDELGVDRHSDRSPKKKCHLLGETHTHLSRHPCRFSKARERAAGE